jgi:glutamine amidotransferase
MCRWLAYYGDPIPIEALVLQRENSLIDQSLHSREGATTTNGDGFGVGWYDELGGTPALYRSVHPAWNNRNLRELAAHIRSPLFFAHIRASTGTAVQETNTHPFRYGRWLFMHNGLVRDFAKVRREYLLAIDPELIPSIEGSADSELLFYLALTFGLEDDPLTALERMAGFVEDVGERNGIEHPLQMSVAATDGRRIIAARYSSEHDSRSLYFSTLISALRERHPEVAELAGLSDEARAVVSEPLGDLSGAWNPVPESAIGIVQEGQDELYEFRPRRPGNGASPQRQRITPITP